MINNPQIEEVIVRFLAKCTPENEGVASLPIAPPDPKTHSDQLTLGHFMPKFTTIDFYPKKTNTGFYWDKFIYNNVEYDVTEFLLEQATKLQP